MGSHRLNAEVLCDHATPEKTSAFRMHMDLTFPTQDFGKLNAMLHEDRWQEFADYFCDLYPEHRQMIEAWCAGSAVRRSSATQCEHRDLRHACAA